MGVMGAMEAMAEAAVEEEEGAGAAMGVMDITGEVEVIVMDMEDMDIMEGDMEVSLVESYLLGG